MNNLLIVCISAKTNTITSQRSAVRSLCQLVYETLYPVIPDVEIVDIVNLPENHDNENVSHWLFKIRNSKAVFFGVPAYWGGVSGVAKNWFDVLCGPAYDLNKVETIFSGKKVGFFIVGADRDSSIGGTEQLKKVLKMAGALLVSGPVDISNPRTAEIDWGRFGNDLVGIAAETTKKALHE